MDPFAVFGDDDDNDDQNEEVETTKTESDGIVQSLIAMANNKNRIHEGSLLHTSSTSPRLPIEQPSTDQWDEITLPWWPPPLYLGPVKMVASLPFGGGRGGIASQDLPPGSLILVEKPIMTWSVHDEDHQSANLQTVHRLFDHVDASSILHAMEHLHPTKQVVDAMYHQHSMESEGSMAATTSGRNDTANSDQQQQIILMMESLRSDYRNLPAEMNVVDVVGAGDATTTTPPSSSPPHLLDLLLDLAATKGLINSDETALTETDLWRLVLAVRYNGLESGLYLHAAVLLNHADVPNCVKFLPPDDNDDDDHDQEPSEDYVSEVRTTRHVLRGEALTISYIPRILSHASRRKYLWDQHRFDIGVPVLMSPTLLSTTNAATAASTAAAAAAAAATTTLYRMELMGHQLPVSALHKWDDNSMTHRIESTIEDLEAMYKEAAAAAAISIDVSTEAAEQAQALEQAALELCTEARQQLQNPQHILLLPCYRLHVDCCDLVQRNALLSVADRMKLLVRLVDSSRQLLALQRLRYGPDHFDIAATALDASQALEELLTRSPRLLLALNSAGTSSSSTRNSAPSARSHMLLPTCHSGWAALEYKLKQDHERIKNLYPHDANDYVLGFKTFSAAAAGS